MRDMPSVRPSMIEQTFMLWLLGIGSSEVERSPSNYMGHEIGRTGGSATVQSREVRHAR
jgi:hypothetical protein